MLRTLQSIPLSTEIAGKEAQVLPTIEAETVATEDKSLPQTVAKKD